MKFWLGLFLIFSFNGAELKAQTKSTPTPIPVGTSAAAPARNVILITMDGVRWDEMFLGSDPVISGQPRENLFPNLLGPLSLEGRLYGDEISSVVEVENPTNVSLPGYENIFLGHPNGCKGNWCPRVAEETIADKIRKDLKLKRKEIAAFTSWGRIRRAVFQIPVGSVRSFGNSLIPLNDSFYQDINRKQLSDLPPWGFKGLPIARWDKYTFDAGFHYLQTEKPRFLYIGLLDSDESAHAGNYPLYLQSLRDFDSRLMAIVEFLKSNPEYGDNTLLIVTTDHGRGDGSNWTSHGADHPASKRMWMYVRPPAGHSSVLDVMGKKSGHSAVRRLIQEWMFPK